MTHKYRLRFLLSLAIALVMLLLPLGKSHGVQAGNDDCQDCVTTCNNERQTCVENGNPGSVCLAAWRSCINYCRDNFCQTR